MRTARPFLRAVVVVSALSASTVVAHDDRRVSFDTSDPRWAAVVNASANPDRVRHALQLFTARVAIDAADDVLRHDAEILAWAAGTARDDAATEGLVTPIQSVRALQALAHAPAHARSLVDDLVARAGDDGERAVLLKAVAHRALILDKPGFDDDMQTLFASIHGKELPWLLEKTTCYGSSFGSGVRQSFKDSCMPAIKLVAEAEFDPLAAIRLHDDVERSRSMLALERDELESHGGVAAARDDPRAWGKGTSDHALLMTLASDLQEHPVVVDHALTAADLDRMEQLLLDGVDLPLRIATKANAVAHSIIIVDVKRQQDGARLFRVHDPWTGQSAWFDDAAVDGFGLVPTDRGEPRHITHAYLYEP